MTATKPQPNNGSYDVEIQGSDWQGRTSVSTLAQVSPTPSNTILYISESPFHSSREWRPPKDLGMLQ